MQPREVDTSSAAPPRPSIEVRDPASGRVAGQVPSDSPEVVARLVDRARAARPAWEAMGPRARGSALRAARKAFVRARREIVELLAAETGKPMNDVVGEAFAVCLDVGAAAKHAPRALRPEHVGTRLPRGKARIVRRVPHGVVGVIGPWNAPLTLTLGDAVYALAAGNT
ncbi:MAG: aldehyde dehydrogenase family protein, partial [Alphaproteobacteria bacterium]